MGNTWVVSIFVLVFEWFWVEYKELVIFQNSLTAESEAKNQSLNSPLLTERFVSQFKADFRKPFLSSVQKKHFSRAI